MRSSDNIRIIVIKRFQSTKSNARKHLITEIITIIKIECKVWDRYSDISQNSRLCPKFSNFPHNVFIRNKSIIWHSINNRTSTSPNSVVRLSCRIAECDILHQRVSFLSLLTRKRKKHSFKILIVRLSSLNYRLIILNKKIKPHTHCEITKYIKILSLFGENHTIDSPRSLQYSGSINHLTPVFVILRINIIIDNSAFFLLFINFYSFKFNISN